MNEIYGVDPNDNIDPKMVRDAMVKCFICAHQANIDQSYNIDKNHLILEIIIKAFNDSGGDFNKPTKESILKAVKKLRELALNFRDPKLVEKHFNEIKTLTDKLG